MHCGNNLLGFVLFYDAVDQIQDLIQAGKFSTTELHPQHK